MLEIILIKNIINIILNMNKISLKNYLTSPLTSILILINFQSEISKCKLHFFREKKDKLIQIMCTKKLDYKPIMCQVDGFFIEKLFILKKKYFIYFLF